MALKINLYRPGPSVFAIITSDTTDMSVLLHSDMPASESLRKSAAQMREKAERLLKNASVIEAATELL